MQGKICKFFSKKNLATSYQFLTNHLYFFSGLKVLLITLYRSWREILLLIVLLAIAVLVFGPLVYFMTAGINPEPDLIGSIPSGKIFISAQAAKLIYSQQKSQLFFI